MKRLTLTSALLLAIAGCSSDATGVDAVLADLTSAPLPGISVTLDVMPRVATSGDTVRLVVKATNYSDQRVEATGGGCGPGMDVAIIHPDGTARTLLQGLVFTCEMRPEHVYQPGQRHTLEFFWKGPAEAGEYTAVGGLRHRGGLRNPSAPVRISVR